MDDSLNCPICNNKFRNIKRIGIPFGINKDTDCVERLCTGMNHSLQIFTDTKTKKVDFMKLSLDPKYSKFLEIDFYNQKCRVICLKNGSYEYIKIEKMIEPDFPHLEKLKEKIAMFVVFS